MQRAGEEIEAYGVHRRVTAIQAETGGAIRQVDQAETLGIGVRLISGQRSGYASTTDLAKFGLSRCVEQARAHAELSNPQPANRLAAASSNATLSASSNETPTAASAELADRLALATDLARTATNIDPRVRVIDNATCRDERTLVEIASTTGLHVQQRRSFVELWVDVVGDDGSVTASGSAYQWAAAHSDCDPRRVAAEAVDRAVRLLGPRVDVPADTPVVCSPDVAAAFIAAAGRALVAPLVRSGRGPLAGGLGSTVGSPSVRLVDDGLHPSSKRAGFFDDEGVARHTTPLIERGVVVGMLQSSATTRDDEMSTGNAFRGSYKSQPDVAPTTLVLDPTGTVSELMTGAPVLVYVQQMTGDRSGISAVSGRVDIAVAGYVLGDGGVVGAFAAMPVSSTLRDVLQAIDAEGDDARPVFGSPALSPTLRLCAGCLA
jgi:predicted Zn-dependent protease